MRKIVFRWLALTVTFGCAAMSASPAQAATGSVGIDVLSSRADLVSGGDAVIAISCRRAVGPPT